MTRGEVERLAVADCDRVFIVNLNSETEREFPISALAGRKSIRVP
jgi:hypothetical protein